MHFMNFKGLILFLALLGTALIYITFYDKQKYPKIKKK